MFSAVFPGQGSQRVGMGKEFYDNYQVAKDMFNRADEALGYKISEICFNGPEEKIKESKITQPAVFLVSAIIFNLIKDKVKFSSVAGHSLGEYTALYASGALSFETALFLTAKRGELFSKISGGTMAAILGLDDEIIKNICNELSSEGVINAANFNCPGQVVISGEEDIIKKAMKIFIEKGAKKTVELAVSGAFHSKMMEKAANKFQGILNDIEFKEPSIDFYANVTAKITKDPDEIRTNLIRQITESVRWTETIQNMTNNGENNFVEIGPSSVLRGMIKKIQPEVSARSIISIAKMNKFLDLEKG